MGLKWSNELSFDHGQLDEEHKIFIDLANLFIDQGKKFIDIPQAETYLDKLRAHLVTHMQHEEDYQESIRYEDREAHAKLHRKLIAQLDDIRTDLTALKGYDLTEINRGTAHFLMNFLVKHLLYEDMKIKQVAQKHAPAADGDDEVIFK